jgi:hypothetical protein
VDGASAAGAHGQIKVTYISARALIGSIAAVAGTDAYGNSYPADFSGVMVAINPTAVPQVAETWHNIPLATTFTAGTITPKYRLTADGMVEMEGEVTYTPTTGTSILGLSFSTVGGFTSTATIGDTVFFGFEGRFSLTNP